MVSDGVSQLVQEGMLWNNRYESLVAAWHLPGSIVFLLPSPWLSSPAFFHITAHLLSCQAPNHQ